MSAELGTFVLKHAGRDDRRRVLRDVHEANDALGIDQNYLLKKSGYGFIEGFPGVFAYSTLRRVGA